MGKQIGFFLSNEDEEELLRSILNDQTIIFDLNGKIINYNEVKEYKFYISKPDSKIVINDIEEINELDSEVIEFYRCKLSSNKQLSPGRFWVEMNFYDEQGEKKRKSDWLNQMYNKFAGYVRKNFRKSKDSYYYYIAEEAYNYYKQDEWKMKIGPSLYAEF